MKKTILKIKTFLLLAVLSVSTTNVFSQSTSLISACGDFTSGPSAWPYVLTATTVADGAASQSAQSFTMNVTSLPAGGANVRVYKTTANGSAFFASPVALTLGSNSITVASVSFDRAVKFQFSSGDVVFDALSLNGVASSCVDPTITPAVPGCTDPTASNYDPLATLDDGSCNYGPWDVTSTDCNMTVLVAVDTDITVEGVAVTDPLWIGAFNGDGLCTGSSYVTPGVVNSVAVWGAEAGDVNGMANGEEIIWAVFYNGEEIPALVAVTPPTDTDPPPSPYESNILIVTTSPDRQFPSQSNPGTGNSHEPSSVDASAL